MQVQDRLCCCPVPACAGQAALPAGARVTPAAAGGRARRFRGRAAAKTRCAAAPPRWAAAGPAGCCRAAGRPAPAGSRPGRRGAARARRAAAAGRRRRAGLWTAARGRAAEGRGGGWGGRSKDECCSAAAKATGRACVLHAGLRRASAGAGRAADTPGSLGAGLQFVLKLADPSPSLPVPCMLRHPGQLAALPPGAPAGPAPARRAAGERPPHPPPCRPNSATGAAAWQGCDGSTSTIVHQAGYPDSKVHSTPYRMHCMAV